MNDFLTRFVWIMPGGWKRVVLNICLVLWRLFSGDLWKTEWEVSNAVLKDIERERKEKMMGFLQCEEVREMRTFSGEIGIRGDMLREFRFKWACEKMEESGFYERLTRVREEEKAAEEGRNSVTRGEEKPKVVTLPMRHGKMKRTRFMDLIFLILSGLKLLIESMSQKSVIGPRNPSQYLGNANWLPVTEKILALKEEDDPSPLIVQWVELRQPSRIDWLTLLDKLKEEKTHLYLKVQCSLFFCCYHCQLHN